MHNEALFKKTINSELLVLMVVKVTFQKRIVLTQCSLPEICRRLLCKCRCCSELYQDPSAIQSPADSSEADRNMVSFYNTASWESCDQQWEKEALKQLIGGEYSNGACLGLSTCVRKWPIICPKCRPTSCGDGGGCIVRRAQKFTSLT